ncbi:cytochrome c biogenesis protein CcsA [Mitsuokella sp.]|uniref:cytochrome c biogenesis protein CcsA n=1 Tax=unclassified Mitsuokella TaxID=2637239 RepID=UPI003D7CDAA7
MIGTISLATSLFFSLLAALAYGYAMKDTEDKTAVRYGRICFSLSFLAAAIASIFLWVLILGDHFEFSYVASYSSKELPLMYKISAFWAGQQGSLLLWLLIHAMASLYLCFRGRMQKAGLMVYAILESLLAILVLAKSPFVHAATLAQDGVGLNPLLQDPWMAVHPPIIFIGYALLAVPFAYCMGSLLEKSGLHVWLESARRWALLAWGFLGAGVFVGGYWAYKVLGWGGYWGWDPVENSSLVPWLLAGVFVHVLHVAKKRPAALSVLHLSVIFTFSLVIYGTFLTRSGILGDFSVHSFSGASIGMTLAVVNAIVLIGGLLLLVLKVGSLPQGQMYTSYKSREFLLLLGALILTFIAAIIFIGMSMPLLTQLVGSPAAVDTNFYVRTTLPLAIVMCLVMGVAGLWRYGGQETCAKSIPALILLVLGLAAAFLAGVRSIGLLLLSAFAAFLFGASFASWKRGMLRGGALIAHAGVGLALFAMVLSGGASQSLSQEFKPGDSVNIAGYTVQYEGQSFADDGTAKYYRYLVDGSEVQALTKLHKNGEDAAREPAIAHTITGDIYIAPTPPKNTGRMELILKKGRMEMGDIFAYRYDDVTMENQPDGKLLVTASIAVTDGEKVEHVQPTILATADGGTSEPIPIFDGKKRIRLTGISGNDSQARLEILPSVEEESQTAVTAAVSTKPFIYLLWIGAVAAALGCFAAIPSANIHRNL